MLDWRAILKEWQSVTSAFARINRVFRISCDWVSKEWHCERRVLLLSQLFRSSSFIFSSSDLSCP
jgi:hypothetical protein